MSSTLSAPSLVDETTLLADLGLTLPRQVVIRPGDLDRGAAMACAELPGSRVVLKVVQPHIAHKTELGAVRIVERTEEAIRSAATDLAIRLDAREIAVCEFVEHDLSPGGELLLAIRWTDELGPVVTFGLGGVAAEVLASVAVLTPGFAADPDIALRDKAFAPLVTGHRNQKARISHTDLRILLGNCLAFASSRMPHTVTEIEINPLVPANGKLYALDVLVTDGRAELEVTAPRPIDRIEHLLHPKRVAVMGVSATSVNAGRIIARNAHAAAIVKNDATAIDGIPCVPDLQSLDPVDLLVLSVPAEQVPGVIEEAIRLEKAESIVVIPGGLGEHAGSEDLEQQVRRTIAAARSTPSRGPAVNGANCLGVASPDVNTIFLPREKLGLDDVREVPLAIVSQSGALAVAAQTKLAPYAPRYTVSIGNQLDLTVSDYLKHFARTADVDVLAFYVEGFAPLDGREWFETAAQVVRGGRTVILYRAGRTAAGRRATSSHTASIAGDAFLARELARATGVLYAETLDDFLDLMRLSVLLHHRRPRGLRMAAMSNAGFDSVAIADNHGPLTLASLASSTCSEIAKVLAESRLERIVTVANPLDVNPLLGDAAYARLAGILLEDDGVDMAVIGCVPLTGALRTLDHEIASEQSVAKMLTKLWHATSKPWVVSIDAGPLYDAMARRLAEEGIPVFRSSDRAVRALGAWSATLFRS